MDVRVLIPMLIFALLAVSSGWLLYRSSYDGDIDRGARHTPDFFLENFNLTSMDSEGQPHHILSGTALRHYGDDDSSEIDQPRLKLVGKTRPQWSASAGKAHIASDGAEIRLEQDVLLQRSSPEQESLKIESSSITLWPDQERAATDQPIKLTSDTRTVTATGLRSNWATGQHTLLSNVRGRYAQN